MNVNVPQHLLEEVANYLVTRPYREVAQLITELAKVVNPQLTQTQNEDPPAS